MKQLNLFDLESEQASSPHSGQNGSAFNDPAFAGNKTLPIHRWVPWIAGFSRDFVSDVLSRYLKRHGTVLDPFAGVGTTLVEAVIQGHDAIGFEINPYAALACRTKVNAQRLPVEKLDEEIARFQVFFAEADLAEHTPKSKPPDGFKTRSAFFSPQIMKQVLLLQDFVNTVNDDNVQDVFRLAFAATMISYSNYSYEPSLGRRVSAGKQEIHDFKVDETLANKLKEMAQDVKWVRANLAQRKTSARVFNDSFFNYQNHLSADSIDFIVTSPPYLNNYHYNRNTRPQLYWLGFVEHPNDMKPLEESNFGKYWQTVRDKECVELDFTLPGTDLEETLQALRKLNPEKGIYGGNGWANYAASYFNDCYRFATGIKHVLKSGGTALVVLGNSILQGLSIPTDQYMAKIAESVGLELVGIEIPRTTRVGNSIIQSDVRVGKAQDSHQLYEAIVELRKK